MKRFLAMNVMLVLAACAQKPGGSSDQPTLSTTPGGAALPIDHPPLDGSGGTGGGGGSGGTGGTGGSGYVSGGARRLSLQQLRASLPVVLGNNVVTDAGITWNAGIYNLFDANAAALGEPDFLNTVDENLEPSPLYLKFMGDAARAACNTALTSDYARPTAASRAILRFASTTDTVATNANAVNANLRYLKLRFHGIKVADTDVDSIASYRQLFIDGVTTAANGAASPTAAHVKEGWRVVCVALLTAPEYHIY